MSIRTTRQILATLLLLPLAFALQAQPSRYTEGTHYQELSSPVRTNNPEKIEVIEVFWYGCGHCYRFQPLIEDWQANMADDIDFVRFPAMWNNLMKVHAQAFYTARSLGVVDQVHDEIFDAMHMEGNRLQNESQIGDLFAANGVDRDEFSEAFNSFSVRTQVNQAEQRNSDYQIRSTPNMVVNGKYLVATGQGVPSQEEMLNVVDYLIEQERNAR